MIYSEANRKRAIFVLTEMEKRLSRPYGWVRKRMSKRLPYRNYSAYCLIGANDAAMTELPPLSPTVYAKTRRQVYDVLVAEIGVPSILDVREARTRLIVWNDQRSRTKREVEALVRRARERLEAE